MRADLQALVDRFGATGWYYSPVDPNTPRFYTTLRDWTVGGFGFGKRIPPEAIATSGASLGDFVAYTWDKYPDGPIALTDNTRGFVWHPNMSRYVTRAFEIRDEGYYDVAPNSRTFFDRLTFGVAAGLITGGTVAIGAGLAGALAPAAIADVAPFVGPIEAAPAAAIADVVPFVGPIEAVATTTPGWTLAETVAAATTVGTSTMEGVKVLNQVAGAVGAVAAVSAAIQGPAGGSAPAPAPAPPPDSVGEKFSAVFNDLKTQLSSVDKKTWYMVGGAVVLLSLG